MQIKGRVKSDRKVTTVELIPNIREQNRMNSGAFTEHLLGYYVGKPSDISLIRSMRIGTGWRSEAQTFFMNVVDDSAKAFGLSIEDIKQNLTKSEANAFEEK
jgi:hypothetical protein